MFFILIRLPAMQIPWSTTWFLRLRFFSQVFGQKSQLVATCPTADHPQVDCSATFLSSFDAAEACARSIRMSFTWDPHRRVNRQRLSWFMLISFSWTFGGERESMLWSCQVYQSNCFVYPKKFNRETLLATSSQNCSVSSSARSFNLGREMV